MSKVDAIIFGAPTRFGNIAGQTRTFLDQTGGLWASGALINKIGRSGHGHSPHGIGGRHIDADRRTQRRPGITGAHVL